MIIIPAIDIMNGRCVRLSQGDFNRQTVYDEDPLEIAMKFADAGIERLHLVDLDGAKTGSVKNWKTLERIAGKTKLLIDFSGGINSDENLSITFNSGAAFATIGSVAINDPAKFQHWIKIYGAEKFILAADVNKEKITVNGWATTTTTSVYEHIKLYQSFNLSQFLCTDISKDGLLAGTAVQLYGNILDQFPTIELIASGGIGNLSDIHEVQERGCAAVIIGKALYENRISLKELKIFLQ